MYRQIFKINGANLSSRERVERVERERMGFIVLIKVYELVSF